MAKPTGSVMERIVALCKRRGFIFQSSEIYGGINGFWDYGPLGTELKRNVREAWWQDMVCNPPTGPDGREIQMVGVDCSIIMNPKVWEASGHATGFADPMVDDRETKQRFRADQIQGVFCLDNPLTAAGGVDHGDMIARHQATIPNRTVVADSFEEAVSLLEHDKSLRKALGVRSIERIGFVAGFTVGLEVSVDLGRGPERALVTDASLAVRRFPNEIPSPFTGRVGTLTPPRQFNLMFETFVGAIRNEDAVAYLRPETAQGIFVNFKNVVDSTRIRVPFGVAQIGKSFRNEINPRNYTFRSREFDQYEIEFFCHPSEADQWYTYWRDLRHQWYVGLGLRSDKLRLRNHEPDELAHYARSCADVEYDFPFGISELEGIANRTDFDLSAHIKHSGKDLSYFDDQRKERYVPYVIEPSGGVDRSVLAFICEAYTVDESRPSPELMKFHPRLAPIKAAVFPLVNKDGMPDIAEPIYADVRKHWPAQYDAKASIGKRYARMDEAGTPFCFTIDGQTKEDGTVTVRDRDTGHQIRIDKTRVVEYLQTKLQV